MSNTKYPTSKTQHPMNQTLRILSLLLVGSFVFLSCEKEDTTTPPEIFDFVAGTHYPEISNTVVKSPGAEIIVDFGARSMNDGRLTAYHIEIHDHPESGLSEHEYLMIEELFDNNPVFNGLRNASIHKHIAIPADAPLGEYHVEVVVIDEFGNATAVDTLVYLVEDTGTD
jgi:hypothetical protein